MKLSRRDFGYHAHGAGHQDLKAKMCACIHVADEGGFDLGRFPAIGTWMGCLRAWVHTDNIGMIPDPTPATEEES
jgi:hypothetical protein